MSESEKPVFPNAPMFDPLSLDVKKIASDANEGMKKEFSSRLTNWFRGRVASVHAKRSQAAKYRADADKCEKEAQLAQEEYDKAVAGGFTSDEWIAMLPPVEGKKDDKAEQK